MFFGDALIYYILAHRETHFWKMGLDIADKLSVHFLEIYIKRKYIYKKIRIVNKTGWEIIENNVE